MDARRSKSESNGSSMRNGVNLTTSLENKDLHNANNNNKQGFVVIIAIFFFSFLILLLVYSQFPHLDEDEKEFIKLPRNIEDAKKLGNVLSRYKDKYYYQVLGGMFIVYIFLQSFAIPGSIFLSILSGYLFSFYIALFLVCLCSAIGASLCFCLSNLVGRRIVLKYFPERVASWSAQVAKHGDQLLYYIIFLRITPFLPNWFINITSPVISVPLKPFFFGTFLGVAPPSFIAIQAGMTLQELTSSEDAVSLKSIILLSVFAILAMIPVLIKKQLKEKIS